MQHSGGFKQSKQTQLFADADTIISVHGVMCDVYQSRLKGVQRSCKARNIRASGVAHTSVAPVQQHAKASRHSSKLNSSPRLRNASHGVTSSDASREGGREAHLHYVARLGRRLPRPAAEGQLG